MVRLTRIYTRTGDGGTTALGDGSRVDKDAPRIEAFGALDEANAALGLAVTELGEGSQLAALLRSAQQDLFDAGADLSLPRRAGERPGARLRIEDGHISRLEAEIDRLNAALAPLTSFVLPGGGRAAGFLHLARVMVRRAERRIVRLQREEPEAVNQKTLRFVNRLSDFLFVAARAANAETGGDILWTPGANRGP